MLLKKNTLPILSNVLIQLKNKKLVIIATDLDIIFYDEIMTLQLSTKEALQLLQRSCMIY